MADEGRPGRGRVRDVRTGADPAPSSAAGVEDRLLLAEVLGELAPVDRAVVVLRYLEDLSVDEVAARLGLSSTASGPGFATHPSGGMAPSPRVEVGPVLRGDYTVLSTPSLRDFSFTYDGGYMTFDLQHEQAGATPRLHDGRLLNGVPYLDVVTSEDGHGVRYASTIAFRDGYEVSLTVYNAAPPSRHAGSERLRRLGARPALAASWRAAVVTSPAWFTTS